MKCVTLFLLLFVQVRLNAADAPFPPNSKPVMLLEKGAGEGPAWHPQLGVLTSGGGHIYRYSLASKLSVHREGAGTNGLLFDHKGQLLACEAVARRVSRTERDGTIRILTKGFRGKRYNQPNDLTVDSRGRIYFSDPKYGPRTNMEIVDKEGRQVEGVYRIDPNGNVNRIITHEVDRPNGLLITPDDRYLYVADNNNNTAGGARKLWRFNLQRDGQPDFKSQKLIHDWETGRGPDGMTQDAAGRIYVAGGLNKPNPPFETADKHKGGITVFSAAGKLLAFVPIPRDEVTNCAFGGQDLRTLYITAGGTLWSIRTNAPGRLPWPKAGR